MNLEQQRLGDYVLAERLGEDRTGVLHRGRHATRNTEVVVKVLARKYADDPAVVARFRRDAPALERVVHPGVAQVLDHGESPHGLFLVMEPLAGESLADRLARDGRVPLEQTQQIVAGVASALAAAHRQRVVHCGLEPGSVFLLPADAGGGVKLLGLGVARILGDGGSKEVDQRADIHGLGRLAYQMLSGQEPVATAPPPGAHANQRPRPAPLAAHGVTVPAAVESAVMKALAGKKKRRFSSMGEFAEAFGVVLAPPPAAVVARDAAASPAPVLAPPGAPPPAAPVFVPPSAPAASPLPAPVATAPARGRTTTLAGVMAPLRQLGRRATGRQIATAAGGLAAAAAVIVWLVARSGGDGAPTAVDKDPPAKRDDRAPAPAPVPPGAPSRVDEILALNQKAVSTYAKSDVKAARALLEEADRLAVASGFADAKVRAQTQVRLGALWIGGEKNPRVGRRYLAKAVAINPEVKLPGNMLALRDERTVLKVLRQVRLKAGVASVATVARVRGKKRSLGAHAARPRGRQLESARQR